MTYWRASVAAAAFAATVSACAGLPGDRTDRVRYQPDRRDYAAFRDREPDVLEPNYLPYMGHVLAEPDSDGFILVLCRWPDEAMPLPVWIETPSVPTDLQDEFHPKDPADYRRAVERALVHWERELEGLVSFRRLERRGDERLTVRLVAEEAPAPNEDVQVLGVTSLRRSCRATESTGEDSIAVDFEVPELRIYLADRFGLLDEDQVEWIALHEIGHALGMRSHSPIPADLMFEVVRDRVAVRELSAEDVNSFVTLYQLPNGTIFTRIRAGASERPPSAPPSGAPELALAPHVDPRLGFDVRPPRGWMRLDTPRGVVAVDGATWDYTASLQVIVEPYDTIEEYLGRYGLSYLEHGWILENELFERAGRRALRAVVQDFDGAFIEELTFIETGDGRLVIVIADSPVDAFPVYRPWFEASLESLHIWAAGVGPDVAP